MSTFSQSHLFFFHETSVSVELEDSVQFCATVMCSVPLHSQGVSQTPLLGWSAHLGSFRIVVQTNQLGNSGASDLTLA